VLRKGDGVKKIDAEVAVKESEVLSTKVLCW